MMPVTATPNKRRRIDVPRYLIERTFEDTLAIPMNDVGRRFAGMVIKNNAAAGVTWIHSYVTADRKQSFCVYDAPTPQALRDAATRNELPIGRITEVNVLNPYFYLP
jgi:hypothetical protein